MSDTGAPFEMPFPTPADFVRLAPADFQALAEKVVDYLLFKESQPNLTTNYTLQVSDTNRVVAFGTTGATKTLTIPANATAAIPVGAVIGVYNDSATDVVPFAAAAGVTVRGLPFTLPARTEVSLRKRAANAWVLAGG
jgi:hypothetical protein